MQLQTNVRLATINENNSNYEFYHIFLGIQYVRSFIGKAVEERDYLEAALNCLRLIGNVHPTMYGHTGDVDKDGRLYLPCEAFEIEYVADGLVDWATWSGFNQQSQYRPSGNLISYRFLRDQDNIPYIEVEPHQAGRSISVAFSTYKQSGDGYPMVTKEEAEACAYYWNFIDEQVRVYARDPTAGPVYQLAKRDKDIKINQARTKLSSSQNFMNQYADVIYSQNWKKYNRGYKPVQLG